MNYLKTSIGFIEKLTLETKAVKLCEFGILPHNLPFPLEEPKISENKDKYCEQRSECLHALN